MMRNKPKSVKAATDSISNEATESGGLRSGDLRFLISELVAPSKSHDGLIINNVEFQALSAMIAYVAFTQKVNESTVCEVLTSYFTVNELKVLPSRLYQIAIEYLVDLKINKVVN